jgi:acyl-CoA-binding protein
METEHVTELSKRFDVAQREVLTLTQDPGNQAKLTLYALFKQATSGDVTGQRPGVLNVVGRAKYDAHAGLQGVSTQDAMQRYVDLVAQLKESNA